MSNQSNPDYPNFVPGFHNDPDPTPIVLPSWVNNPYVILTDGEKKRKVRVGDPTYRVLVANGWKEVKS